MLIKNKFRHTRSHRRNMQPATYRRHNVFFLCVTIAFIFVLRFLRVHLLRVLNKKRVMFSICPFVRSSVCPSVRLFVRRYQTYEYEFWIRINRTCCKSAKRFMGQGDKTIKRSKIKVTGSQNRPNSWPRYLKKNEWTDFAATWLTEQGDETIKFGGQEVKDQGHTTPKLHLEAWRRHHSRPLGRVGFLLHVRHVISSLRPIPLLI